MNAGADRLSGLAAAPRALAGEAIDRLQGGHAADAAALLDRALAVAGEHDELLRLRALADLHLGAAPSAVTRLQRALALRPRDALLATQLGGAFAQAGDMPNAEAWFREACALDPRSVDAGYNLGVALAARAASAEARAVFARVLEVDPRHRAARLRLAEVATALGELEVAEATLTGVLHEDPGSVPAWVGLAALPAWQPDPGALERLLSVQASGRVQGMPAISLAFACARFLERADRLDEAWAMFAEANARKRAVVPWDAAAVSAWVDAILAAFAGGSPGADDDLRGHEAIFIVGLPRSGSTVLEQVLSAHPAVAGAGETNAIAHLLQDESARRRRPFPQWVAEATAADWRRLGEAYLAMAAAWRGERPRFTDKTLSNWQLVGAIRRMLPGARIVHCRRDPLETAWSAYRQHFAEGQGFSYDLDALVAFQADCTRAMRRWQDGHARAIVDHDHDALLDDAPAAIRRVLAACGLAFEPACLAFQDNRRAVHTASAARVREPLSRPRASAARYGDRLAPLATRLSTAAGRVG